MFFTELHKGFSLVKYQLLLKKIKAIVAVGGALPPVRFCFPLGHSPGLCLCPGDANATS